MWWADCDDGVEEGNFLIGWWPDRLVGARTYTLALVCLLARDVGDTSQSHPKVDGGPEIGTGGLSMVVPTRPY